MFSEVQYTDTEILIYTYSMDQEPGQEEEKSSSYPAHVCEKNGIYYCASTTQNGVYWYTYVMNNPLRFTDPSGYKSDFGKWLDYVFGKTAYWIDRNGNIRGNGKPNNTRDTNSDGGGDFSGFYSGPLANGSSSSSSGLGGQASGGGGGYGGGSNKERNNSGNPLMIDVTLNIPENDRVYIDRTIPYSNPDDPPGGNSAGGEKSRFDISTSDEAITDLNEIIIQNNQRIIELQKREIQLNEQLKRQQEQILRQQRILERQYAIINGSVKTIKTISYFLGATVEFTISFFGPGLTFFVPPMPENIMYNKDIEVEPQ